MLMTWRVSFLSTSTTGFFSGSGDGDFTRSDPSNQATMVKMQIWESTLVTFNLLYTVQYNRLLSQEHQIQEHSKEFLEQ